MTRMLFGIATLALLVAGPRPATADYYGAPWCAVISMGDGDMQWDCEYRSLEECRPNVLAGNRGWCNPNPYPIASYRHTETRHSRQPRARARAQ